MSYIQGTKVRLDVAVADSDTGLPADPSTLICRIKDPTAHIYDQALGSGVLRSSIGQYRAIMDTAPAPGVWAYEWIVDPAGAAESIASGRVNVRTAIPAPV